jgi:hypothetical protein
MEITAFLSISIVGVILSFIIDVLKVKLNTTSTGTKALTAILALVIAGLFWWLASTPYIQSVATVLGMASTAYAFLLKK